MIQGKVRMMRIRANPAAEGLILLLFFHRCSVRSGSCSARSMDAFENPNSLSSVITVTIDSRFKSLNTS